jgi:hypothetical protein
MGHLIGRGRFAGETYPNSPYQGGPPPPPIGGETVVTIPFAYNTPSPLILLPVTALALVNRAAILIETAFDGPFASLALGTSVTPNLLLSAAENLPSLPGQYETDLITSSGGAGLLQLVISPGGSTMGNGFVLVKVKG